MTAVGTANPTVKRIPQAYHLPTWLKLLIKVQGASLVTAFLLAGAALAVYGWTVHSRQLWSNGYEQLAKLQRTERQLIAVTESQKDHLAKQAGLSGAGLVPQTPANTVFLRPAPQRPLANKPVATKTDTTSSPLGY